MAKWMSTDSSNATDRTTKRILDRELDRIVCQNSNAQKSSGSKRYWEP